MSWNRPATAAGYLLTRRLPGIAPDVLDAWLGPRWYILHAAEYQRTALWCSIISSRLARGRADQRPWPHWLSAAVASSQRSRQTCLIVPGTTTATWLEVATIAGEVPALTIELAEGDGSDPYIDLDPWQEQWLQRFTEFPDQMRHKLCISPAIGPACGDLASLPLGDRAAVVLAHYVLAISVREAGTLERLLEARLADDRFPEASVRVRLPQSRPTATTHWLDRRAVGWYVPGGSQPPVPHSETRSAIVQTHCLHRERLGQSSGRSKRWPSAQEITARSNDTQWNAPLRLLGNWSDYLVHCVRGSSNAREALAGRQAVLSALLNGHFDRQTPWQRLLEVIGSGRLRASGQLLRGGERMISFSAVPLPDLLARRSFQAHLSRWDWEPYGLLINRRWLQQQGARPVIYGDEATYQLLSPAERPFFQPALRRLARHREQHWQAECEWRMGGDLILNELPCHAARVFVQFQDQAEALATSSRWPVIWLQSARIPPRPTAAKRRRGSSVGTDKN